ncbi:MAG: 7-carboxy-7-deazaguanine synthase QueE [Paramuribaculum sp.]|nr:7-carboxy-7-deazaguanine synthase QueE [Paramuribaculum sp.]MDE7451921.1 7-carboxy-7-deazaguanine synthase QueE [Paramuribaculum sp.]
MLRVNEIFYSLQGEGFFTGIPAVFVRLSGCNLKCPFCDTNHSPFTEMAEEDIIREIKKYPAKHIVITGGEPALQLSENFIDLLHENDLFVQIETNGTVPLPENIDWVTCSPKSPEVVLRKINELKVLFDGEKPMLSPEIPAEVFTLQPLDTGIPEDNIKITEAAIRYIKNHPKWRLSLQTHKMLNIR